MANFQDPYYEGRTKVNYQLDEESGEIKKIQVAGWEAEYESTERAWEELRSELAKCRKQIDDNKASALAYYMTYRMMDSHVLAAEAGVCHLFTLRHLRNPRAWQNLKIATKQKYSEALDIPLEQLEKIPKGEDER